MSLDTDKHWIRELAATCAAMGVNKVVISPGSRCAPLTIAFNRHPGIECLSIIDERSAAFFALGMAQQLQKPVALVCTSGSAVLNYAPAIAEAYYQGVPLVIFTADRPPELIDQGDGQTIRQNEVYRNYIKRSFQLPVDVNDEETLRLSNSLVSEAIYTSIYAGKGPVHVNVPLREPLYELKEYGAIEVEKTAKSSDVFLSVIEESGKAITGNKLETLLKVWQNCPRKLIVAGGYPPSQALQKAIQQLSTDASVAVVAEITANLQGPGILNCPDALLSASSENRHSETHLIPDLLVTFGGGIVSKKLKAFLRTHPVKEHWHIHPAGLPVDTYQQLTKTIAMEPETFFGHLSDNAKPLAGNYHNNWLQLLQSTNKRHNEILDKEGYNDLKVFDLLLNNISEGSNLHLGNSTPIRYAGLFHPKPNITYNCNRGTSGIDGTVSTAAGAALVNGRWTTIITGDLAFFYDSNALWNRHLPGNLRIIIINNGGGNIFRVLQGPSQMPELEEFFETKMDLNAKNIALTYGLPYYFCDDLKTLEKLLPKFFQPNDDKCAILEIKTPAEESALAMRRYLNLNG